MAKIERSKLVNKPAIPFIILLANCKMYTILYIKRKTLLLYVFICYLVDLCGASGTGDVSLQSVY